MRGPIRAAGCGARPRQRPRPLRHAELALPAQRALAPGQSRRNAVPAGEHDPQGHHPRSYLGVSGFFLALPNCLRLLSHWIVRAPLWSKRDSDRRARQSGGRDRQLRPRSADGVAAGADARARQWGYDHLESSAAAFIEPAPPDSFAACGRTRAFAASLMPSRHPGPGPSGEGKPPAHICHGLV